MNAKNSYGQKYGITKMLKDMRKSFDSRMAALNNKDLTRIYNSIKEHGADFSSLYKAEKNNAEGAANAFYSLHVNMVHEYIKTWEPNIFVESNHRTQYIRFYEATLEKALEIEGKHQDMIHEAVQEKLAAKGGK